MPVRQLGTPLTGRRLTGRHLSAPDVGVGVHGQDIAELLAFDRLEDVILVGHSYGGMAITAAAALVPDRVGQVVYVDAFSPTTGDSAFSLVPWLEKAFAETPAPAEWEVAPLDPALLGADEEGAAWLAGRLTPMPLRTHQEPLGPGSEQVLAAKPVSYFHCADQGFFADLIPSAQSRGFRIVGLTGINHIGLLTEPRTLADELLALVPAAD